MNKKGICINRYDIRMVLTVILWQWVNGSRTLAHKIRKEILFNKEVWDVHFILDECTTYKWAILQMFWKPLLPQSSRCSAPQLLHYIQCMPTIRSPSDGQQKENDILEESLCSYWLGEGWGVRGWIYGSPAWKLLARTVVRKRGRGESNRHISPKNG